MARTATRKPSPVRITRAGMDQGRRPDIEDDLSNLYHVQWTYLPSVDLGEIDTEKSRHNQARFEAIDEKVVATYAEAMKRDEHFPPLIVYRPTPTGDFIIIDGNHRQAAAMAAGRAKTAIYEVDPKTDPKTIALMTFACNTKHGMPTSETERITQAVYLYDNGASLHMAAAAVNIPERHLKKALERAKADARADEVGFPRNKWETIGATIRARLSAIPTDEVFLRATKLAYAANLSFEEIQELVSMVNATKSATKQMAAVKDMEAVHQDAIQAVAGGVLGTAEKRKMNPKARATLAAGQALALPDDPKVIASAYAQPERAEAAKRFMEAAVRFQRLSDYLTEMS